MKKTAARNVDEGKEEGTKNMGRPESNRPEKKLE